MKSLIVILLIIPISIWWIFFFCLFPKKIWGRRRENSFLSFVFWVFLGKNCCEDFALVKLASFEVLLSFLLISRRSLNWQNHINRLGLVLWVNICYKKNMKFNVVFTCLFFPFIFSHQTDVWFKLNTDIVHYMASKICSVFLVFNLFFNKPNFNLCGIFLSEGKCPLRCTCTFWNKGSYILAWFFIIFGCELRL